MKTKTRNILQQRDREMEQARREAIRQKRQYEMRKRLRELKVSDPKPLTINLGELIWASGVLK